MLTSFLHSCGYPVYVSQTHNGARCNYGPGDGPHESRCIRDGNPFWTMWPGQSAQIPWNTGVGSNLKLHREPWDGAPVLQFEYTRADPSVPDHLAYNFSDIDGAGPGAVGSPFRDGNVRATPVGPGVGWDTCNVLTCPANQACPDSYQYPSDNSKMHVSDWILSASIYSRSKD